MELKELKERILNNNLQFNLLIIKSVKIKITKKKNRAIVNQ